MSEPLEAFVFINFLQALRFGHIAWGFSTGPDKYLFGSADHLLKRPMWDLPALLGYSHVEPGGDIDFWVNEGSLAYMLDDLTTGKHIRYHSAKRILVLSPQPEAARQCALSLSEGGWSLMQNNCLHHTIRVLTAFGLPRESMPETSLLKPLTMVPVHWFANIEGETVDLRARLNNPLAKRTLGNHG